MSKTKEEVENLRKGTLTILHRLGIDPSKVLSFDIFVLTRTAVIKTVDGDIHCHLVEGKSSLGEPVLEIVRDQEKHD